MQLLTGLLMAVALQLPAAPGPEISRVQMAVSLTQPGDSVDVVVRYQLQLPAGADDIPLHAVAFLGAQPAGLRASIDGHPAEAELSSSKPSALSGQVRLPRRRVQAGAVDLELRYRVDGSVRRKGNDLDATVPVLFVTGHPSDSPEDFFVARVQVPAEHIIYEVFPTVQRSVEHSGGTNNHTLELQAVPAMVRWHGRIGAPPLVPFELMVNIFTIGALLVLSILTYRVLRGA